MLFSNIFNLFNRKEVTVQLDSNVSLTLVPVTGGVNAVLIENGAVFTRRETCYFATCDELIKSLRLTDDRIVRKLSKAF